MKKYLKEMKTAAIAAGKLLKKMQGKAKVHIKEDRTRVTEADLASDKTLRTMLAKAFPDIPYESEESTSGGYKSEGLWWLADPLDGTDNYVMGNPHFCVSLALMKGHNPVAGAVYDPSLDEIFYAAKGTGAFCNGSKIKCSARTKLIECTAIIEFGRGRRQIEQAKALVFEHVLYHIDRMRYYGAAALDISYVSAGRFDAALYNLLKPHDYAAATVILREAGGKLTDFNGKFNLKSSEVLAGSNKMHAKFRKLVANLNTDKGKYFPITHVNL